MNLSVFLRCSIALSTSLLSVQVSKASDHRTQKIGLYRQYPEDKHEIRDWSLSNRGPYLEDYAETLRGRYLGMHGWERFEESSQVALIELENGQRRGVPIWMFSKSDQQLILELNEDERKSLSEKTEPKTPYAAVWEVYSEDEHGHIVNTFESEHFLFYYGSAENEETALLNDAKFVNGIKLECEAIWDFYENEMGMEMPNTSSPNPQKISVFFYGTGLPLHKDQGANARNGKIKMYPRQFREDIPIFAHELVHLLQKLNQEEFWEASKRGGYYEAHADWLSLNWNPTKGGKSILHSQRFSDYPLFSSAVSYGYWPLLQYMSEEYGPEICNESWSNEHDDSQELPLDRLYRIGAERELWPKEDRSEFSDEIAMAAAKKAYWDFIVQPSYLMRIRERANKQKFKVNAVTRKQPKRNGKRWSPTAKRMPANYGYHTIELAPEEETISVSVNHKKKCDWRLIIVARDQYWNCRYSNISDGTEPLNFKTLPTDKAWALIVMAVPFKYEAPTWKQDEKGSFPRFSYDLEFEGVAPGFPSE